jgi:hypothetical protein
MNQTGAVAGAVMGGEAGGDGMELAMVLSQVGGWAFDSSGRRIDR